MQLHLLRRVLRTPTSPFVLERGVPQVWGGGLLRRRLSTAQQCEGTHLLAAFCVLGAFSLEIAHSLSESPKLVWTHLISPASLNLIQIHPVLLGSSQIHAVSLGFTELRFLSDSDHILILSDSLILAQIQSDLLRFSHVRSISFPFTPDSDQFRSSQIHSFSVKFTHQTHPDLLRLVRCHSDFFRFAQIHTRFRSSQIHAFSFRFTQTHPDVLGLVRCH